MISKIYLLNVLINLYSLGYLIINAYLEARNQYYGRNQYYAGWNTYHKLEPILQVFWVPAGTLNGPERICDTRQIFPLLCMPELT
jgi:hypothetical protein